MAKNYTTDFDKKKNQEEAEAQAGALVKQYNPHTVIKDTSDDVQYQSYDVDFVATNLYIDDTWRDNLFEVKNCEQINATGNLFIELKHYDYTKSQGLIKYGWYYKTKADYIMYRNHVNKAFVWFRLEDLRSYIDTHYLTAKEAIDYKYYDDGTKEQHKKTKGYLVPLFDFTQYCYDSNKEIKFLDEKGATILAADYTKARNYFKLKVRVM